MPSLAYPPAPTSDQADDYHGTRVADPFRPLEDTDAPATRAWIEAQNRVAAAVLDGHAERDELRARLGEVWDFARAGAPFRRGERWFQLRNAGSSFQIPRLLAMSFFIAILATLTMLVARWAERRIIRWPR